MQFSSFCIIIKDKELNLYLPHPHVSRKGGSNILFFNFMHKNSLISGVGVRVGGGGDNPKILFRANY